MKTWNPNASRSGLDSQEQERYKQQVREQHKGEEQQVYTKLCISCHTYFNVKTEEYFHTECNRCRGKIGLIYEDPPRKKIPDPEPTKGEIANPASKQYREESMVIINLFLAGKKDEARDKMLEMEAKYPGRGWRQAHDELLMLEDAPTPQELEPETEESGLPF